MFWLLATISYAQNLFLNVEYIYKMFQQKIETIYNKIKNKPCSGKNADYIPELAKVDSSLYAISIYTIDGQTINLGDYNHEFAIKSCSKVFTLALVLEKFGIPHLKKKLVNRNHKKNLIQFAP